MARKVFISALGAGFYEETLYDSKSKNFESSRTRFVQEATLEYIGASEWGKDSAAYILLTEYAESQNWNTSERKDRNGKIVRYDGLKTVLENMNLPFSISEIAIPDGKNENEIWDIFTKVFEKLEDGDELYFDITYGFRNLPMLILVLGNYAKFLKNTRIMSITYGGFDNKDANGVAPIINLLSLSSLQDWSYAAADYINNGNVKDLEYLCKSSITPILCETKGKDSTAKAVECFVSNLRKFVDEIKGCRGLAIYSRKTFNNLSNAISKIQDTAIAPLNPIFNKVKENITQTGFSNDNGIANLFASAKWCYENGIYQSSVTILQEAIITAICDKAFNGNISPQNREYVTAALNYQCLKIYHRETEFIGTYDSIKKILECDFFSDDVNIKKYDMLSNIRNDINHSGMRNNPSETNRIKSNIQECLDKFCSIFTNIK